MRRNDESHPFAFERNQPRAPPAQTDHIDMPTVRRKKPGQSKQMQRTPPTWRSVMVSRIRLFAGKNNASRGLEGDIERLEIPREKMTQAKTNTTASNASELPIDRDGEICLAAKLLNIQLANLPGDRTSGLLAMMASTNSWTSTHWFHGQDDGNIAGLAGSDEGRRPLGRSTQCLNTLSQHCQIHRFHWSRNCSVLATPNKITQKNKPQTNETNVHVSRRPPTHTRNRCS
ncbi:MAG: hypothetical protein R3E58_01670 [Phycisphaerae bacterium]